MRWASSVRLLAGAPPPKSLLGGPLFLFLFFSKKKERSCVSSGEHEQRREALAQAARACHVHSGPFEVRRSSAKRETGNKRSSAKRETENKRKIIIKKKRDQPLGPGPHILVPALEGYHPAGR